jgi:hypothetical protein
MDVFLLIVFLDNLLRMNDMHYARDPYNPDPCLVGTREYIIENIIRWFSQPIGNGESRVYWLSGIAGCGKSSIARSVTKRLEDQKRCVSFFFHASNQINAGPNYLFATISRNLALRNENWKACLAKVLRETNTSECFTVEDQFEKFILRPAALQENVGPILIVIDALDESGTVQQRRPLLNILKRLHELPPHFRFLITSRPESDIINTLDSPSWVHQYSLREANALLTNLDIEQFVRKCLDDVPKIDKASINAWVNAIVERSEGLFQWAATACRHIQGNGEIGHNPREKLNDVLKLSTYSGLDSLYKTILERIGLSTSKRDDIMSRRFQTIMGRVLLLREPISVNALSSLWYDDEDKGQTELILEPLGSVLSGVWRGNEAVQPIHVSFSDFLREQSRCGKYWINVSTQNEKLVMVLLREMQDLLRFNICNLETSYKPNSDVKDLHARVTNNIQAHLSYACRYWVDHLIQIPATHEWADRVYDFMRSYLLFWFEVLSLIGKFGSALDQLSKLQDWLETLV